MTAFDRLAWRCSWLAPAGLLAALGAVVLDAVAGRWDSAPSPWRNLLPVLALGAGAVGVVAHLVVQYHAVKAGSFSFANSQERSKVEVALRFNMAYGRWRALMRSRHPELRPHDTSPDRPGHGDQ